MTCAPGIPRSLCAWYINKAGPRNARDRSRPEYSDAASSTNLENGASMPSARLPHRFRSIIDAPAAVAAGANITPAIRNAEGAAENRTGNWHTILRAVRTGVQRRLTRITSSSCRTRSACHSFRRRHRPLTANRSSQEMERQRSERSTRHGVLGRRRRRQLRPVGLGESLLAGHAEGRSVDR